MIISVYLLVTSRSFRLFDIITLSLSLPLLLSPTKERKTTATMENGNPKNSRIGDNSRGEIQRDQRIHTNRCNSTENHRRFESDAFPVSQLPLSWCLQKTKTDIIRVYWLHGFRFVQQKVSINIITQTRTTNSGLINTKHTTDGARENS